MKNFRKVLALVLVVATIFSFTAMASAKSLGDYKDAADVNYDVAVDVLTGLEILNGYEDNTFKPTSTISREEMAKMIAVLANTGDDVSKLYATACTFADVAKDRWSASYVAYCAKTGIVAGRSATTFDPYGKVTGLETAKMLLVVMGFSAEEQGYVGADWKVNVLRDAKNCGLLNGFAAGYDVDAAITREEAANMMLNALQANVIIGVVSENILKVTNAATAFKPWDGTLIDSINLNKLGAAKLYGNVIVAQSTLMEALYGNKLTKIDASDCYGRPGSKWTLKNNKGTTVLSGVFFADPIKFTNHDGNVGAVVNSINEEYKLGKYALELFVDGDSKFSLKGYDVAGDKTNLTAELNKYVGKGVLVEVYVDDTKDAEKITIVVINTYIGEVGQMNTARGTFQLLGYNDKTYTAKNNYGFKPADEGTIVLYWICKGGAVHNVEVAEPVTLTVHGIRNTTAGVNFCDSEEKTHEYAKNNVSGEFANAQVGGEFYVFNDKYDYVMLWSPVSKTTYGVSVLVANTAMGTDPVTTNPGNKIWSKYVAKFVDFEANPAVSDYIVIDEATFNVDDESTLPHDILVRYTDGKDGARLKAQRADTALNGNYELNEATGKVTGLSYAGNDYTQYLLRVFNHKTGAYEYKYFDGKEAIDATYKLTNLQYFTDGLRYLTYVYAEADYAATSKLAFVTSYYGTEAFVGHVSESTGKAETYYLYKAYVNGEEALVAYSSKLPENYMKAYKASYVLIQAETHDQLPIYMAVDAYLPSKGTDFIIEGNELTWKDKEGQLLAADMAENATIVVVTNVDGDVDSTVLEGYDELVDYIGVHGWNSEHEDVYGWFTTDANGEINLLYLYVVAQADAEA